MHTKSRHQGWKPQKRTGNGPVHSPAAVTIQRETQHKKHNHTKRNKSKTKTQPNQTAHPNQTNTQLGKWSAAQSGTSDEGEVITLYQLRYRHGRKQGKRKRTNTNITLPYRRVSEATQHYAETRDPPSQDPRDHIEQAIRHDNSHKPKHHFDASNDNAV